MPKKKGDPKTGGRKKGTPNKTGSEVREGIIKVYNKIGGDEQMATWARSEPTEFYKIYAKLLPAKAEVDGNLTGKLEFVWAESESE